MCSSTRQQWQQQLQLFSLEAQRAAESMTMIWVLGLFLALIMLSSWVIVLLLTAQALLILELTTWQTLSVLLLLQGIALFVCLKLIRYHSRYLGFPASVGRAHTHSKASGHGAPPDAPAATATPPSNTDAVNAAMLSALAAEALFAVAPVAAATAVTPPAEEPLPCCDIRDAPAKTATPVAHHCTKEAPCSPSNYT